MLDLMQLNQDERRDILLDILRVAETTKDNEYYLDHEAMIASDEDYVVYNMCKDSVVSAKLNMTVDATGDVLIDGNYITRPYEVMNPPGLSEFLFLAGDSPDFATEDEWPDNVPTPSHRQLFISRIALILGLSFEDSALLHGSASGLRAALVVCWHAVQLMLTRLARKVDILLTFDSEVD